MATHIVRSDLIWSVRHRGLLNVRKVAGTCARPLVRGLPSRSCVRSGLSRRDRRSGQTQRVDRRSGQTQWTDVVTYELQSWRAHWGVSLVGYASWVGGAGLALTKRAYPDNLFALVYALVNAATCARVTSETFFRGCSSCSCPSNHCAPSGGITNLTPPRGLRLVALSHLGHEALVICTAVCPHTGARGVVG